MDYQAATKAIVKFFAQGWGNTTPVAYPDMEFTPPNSAAWVRLTIQHYDGFQASTGAPGSNRFRRKGLVTAQVFTPKGKAGLDAMAKADLIVNLFRGVNNAGIIYQDVQLKEIGNDDAGWYQVNVLAYFHYDHTA